MAGNPETRGPVTDTTFRLFAAERRTRTCSICRQQTRPGSKLCVACKAALKRARHETVSQLEPLPRRAGPGSESVRRPRTRKPAPVSTKPISAAKWRLRHRDLVTVSVAVLALVIYVEAPGWRSRGSPPAPPEAAAAVVPRPPAPVVADSSEVELPQTPAEPVVRTPEALRGETTMMVAPATGARTRVVHEQPAVVAPTPVDSSPSAFGTVEEAQQTAPAPEPVPLPPPRERPQADRWQVMQETIAGCGREGFIDRFICEQKARLAACEGHWGRVPECPSGIANDHGQ